MSAQFVMGFLVASSPYILRGALAAGADAVVKAAGRAALDAIGSVFYRAPTPQEQEDGIVLITQAEPGQLLGEQLIWPLEPSEENRAYTREEVFPGGRSPAAGGAGEVGAARRAATAARAR